MHDADELLHCVDRFGRNVVLRSDIWYDKILSDHPEMAQSLDAVETVLIDPDRVNSDANHPNGENFYRLGVLQHPFATRYLKVVVRYFHSGDTLIGEVISVYAVSHYRKPGERFRWNR
jgi:hypothetical protein